MSYKTEIDWKVFFGNARFQVVKFFENILQSLAKCIAVFAVWFTTVFAFGVGALAVIHFFIKWFL